MKLSDLDRLLNETTDPTVTIDVQTARVLVYYVMDCVKPSKLPFRRWHSIHYALRDDTDLSAVELPGDNG